MSQEDLGKALDLAFQQVQKYERGTNRIGSSRLYQLSRILGVPVSFFFDDMPRLKEVDASGLHGGVQEPSVPGPMDKRETLELVRAYYRIRDPKVRDALHAMARAMAKGAGSR
jgi:transcriptional regulator with XRE-family HTH domain